MATHPAFAERFRCDRRSQAVAPAAIRPDAMWRVKHDQTKTPSAATMVFSESL